MKPIFLNVAKLLLMPLFCLGISFPHVAFAENLPQIRQLILEKKYEKALELTIPLAQDGDIEAQELLIELLFRDLVFGKDMRKIDKLISYVENECSKNIACAFLEVWNYIDRSKDGSLSLAELAKFQRSLVRFAYIESKGDETDVGEIAALNLTTVLLLPITASSILHSFDYNNNGLLEKEEVFGDSEFADLVGLSKDSLIDVEKFKDLGEKLRSSFDQMSILRFLMRN